MQNPHCAFRKPVMGSGFTCEHASLCHTPMGCSVLCQDLDAFDRCNDLLDTLTEAGRFALGYTPGTDTFTHGKLMKVQHGGLLGIQAFLEPDATADRVENISELVDKALQIELPLQDIINGMRHWKTRRRGK